MPRRKMERNIYKVVIQILVHDEYWNLPNYYQMRIEEYGKGFDDEQVDLPSNEWVRAVWKHLYWGEDLPGLTM